MDFKTEILSKAKLYVQEIEMQDATAQVSKIKLDEEPECNYMQAQRSWRQQPRRNQYQR